LGDAALRTVVIVALAAMLSACALTEDVVPIAYAPAAARPVPGAEAIRVTVTAVDARTGDRERISTKINGYGMEMAAIRSEREVAEIVREALSAELSQRGYGLGEGGPRVEVKVLVFHARFSDGLLVGKAEADVDLAVSVLSPEGRALYSHDLKARARRPAQAASGKNAAATLSDALADDFKALFADQAFGRALAGR
jgi:uncharacterized lipoprotein